MDAHDGGGVPQKDRETALLLCVFLGWVGAHRFYAGRIKTGIAMTVVSALGSWFQFAILLLSVDLAARLMFFADGLVFSVAVFVASAAWALWWLADLVRICLGRFAGIQEAWRTWPEDDPAPRSRLAAILLCVFLGWVGAHRFHAGRKGTGLLMLAVSPVFFLAVFISLLMVLPPAFASVVGMVVGMTFSWALEGLQHFIGYAPVIGWVLAWFAWWLVDLVRICRSTGGQGCVPEKAA